MLTPTARTLFALIKTRSQMAHTTAAPLFRSWGTVVATACLMPAAVCAGLSGRAAFSAAGDFSETAILSGVHATQAECANVSNAVWAQTPHSGSECIRYWAAGFDTTPVKRAIVFFHGDIFVGIGKTSKAYLGSSQAFLQANADA